MWPSAFHIDRLGIDPVLCAVQWSIGNEAALCGPLASADTFVREMVKMPLNKYCHNEHTSTCAFASTMHIKVSDMQIKMCT